MTDAARALLEAELTSDEIERILRVCGPRALLVGGQALAAWAVHYGIQPVGELSRSVTMGTPLLNRKPLLLHDKTSILPNMILSQN